MDKGIYKMENNERDQYYIEKYNKEYQCNYKYEEFTKDWNVVGKTDRYKCPECEYTGFKCDRCGGMM